MILLGRVLSWLRRRVFRGLGWWDKHWLRIHLASTAIGGLVLTYFLSGASLTDIWDTSGEFKAAATLAPLAALIYTAFAAMLETGVMAMVLALAVAGKLLEELNERERKREERDQYLMALGREAGTQSQASGESWEEAVARLIAEGWQPPQS